MREREVDIYGIEDRQIVMDMNDKAFEVRDVVVYNYSKPGVCGSILLRENHQQPIISMHFAGVGYETDGEGYGVILSKEMLGYVRGEYSTIPIPGDSVTLNQSDLLASATEAKEALVLVVASGATFRYDYIAWGQASGRQMVEVIQPLPPSLSPRVLPGHLCWQPGFIS